jgi:hypothetical protein
MARRVLYLALAALALAPGALALGTSTSAGLRLSERVGKAR